MRNLVILVILVLGFSCTKESQNTIDEPVITVTDIDGNTYKTVKIGNQVWMAENLKTTRLNDGTPISLHTIGMDWGDLPNERAQYQWAETSDLNNVIPTALPFDYYGAMYNHWAIESGKLAPAGWRIPTKADFQELESYLANNGFRGMEATALKSDSGWLPSTGPGTNAIGFNGLPNGYVSAFGTPTLAEGISTWAVTDVAINIPIGSRTRVLVQLFDSGNILYNDSSIRIGAGIRCIKN